MSTVHFFSGVIEPRRRAFLAGMLAAGLLANASAPLAQDPRNAIVQSTARQWLVFTDKDDGAAAWKAAGKKFQNRLPIDGWSEALVQVRAAMGKVTQRAMIETTYDKTFPGAPEEGDYATVEFRTAFANKSDGRETITLEREPDGVWRVIGYSIH